MAHTKSAAKRAKTSAQRRNVNRSVKSGISGVRKNFLGAVASGDKVKSEELYRQFASILDRSAKKGIIGKNNASRRKARAAARLAALPTA